MSSQLVAEDKSFNNKDGISANYDYRKVAGLYTAIIEFLLPVMQARILEKKKIAKDTWEIVFSRPRDFLFQAGQYCEIILPKMKARDPHGNHREFSIVSSPHEKKVLRIAFRDTNSGFKKTLLHMKRQGRVEVNGPFGQCLLPPSQKQPLIFIAGGIGITPFMSMMRYMVESKQSYNVILFMINRSSEDTPYYEELFQLSRQGNIRLMLHSGTIQKKDIARISGIKKSRVYVAGPPKMVREIVEILRDTRLSEKNIVHEEFDGYN